MRVHLLLRFILGRGAFRKDINDKCILYKNCNNSQDKTYKEICLQDLQANEGNFFRSGVRCINSIIISFLLLILNKSPRKGQ